MDALWRWVQRNSLFGKGMAGRGEGEKAACPEQDARAGKSHIFKR